MLGSSVLSSVLLSCSTVTWTSVTGALTSENPEWRDESPKSFSSPESNAALTEEPGDGDVSGSSSEPPWERYTVLSYADEGTSASNPESSKDGGSASGVDGRMTGSSVWSMMALEEVGTGEEAADASMRSLTFSTAEAADAKRRR